MSPGRTSPYPTASYEEVRDGKCMSVPRGMVFALFLLLAVWQGSVDSQTQATPPSARSNAQGLVFEQPTLTGIRGNFHVPQAEHRYPDEHPFNLLLWQVNPNRSDGELVPTTWKAGDRTGFYPKGRL